MDNAPVCMQELLPVVDDDDPQQYCQLPTTAVVTIVSGARSGQYSRCSAHARKLAAWLRRTNVVFEVFYEEAPE